MTDARGGTFGRRHVLGAVAAIAAGGAPSSRAGAVAVRQDVATLSAAQTASLEAAIGEMQRRSERDPRDPKGWLSHIQVHHAVCATVANDDDAQVHGCWWFLPWHRAFLAVTELKLRALSGDPSLALPYWNWSSDRGIPAAFTRAASPLARAARHTPGRLLTAVEVDQLQHDEALAAFGVAALAVRSFQAHVPEQIPFSFGGIAKPNSGKWHGRNRLEGVPHTAIHNYVGGEGEDGSLGDMTELATAARDPLFYAHHANLDRLWEIWRSEGLHRATEPTVVEFLEQRFAFPWLDGTTITLSVRDTLDTQRLGYIYDRLEVFRAGASPGTTKSVRPALAVERLRLPPDGGRTLRISGVMPGERPLTTEIALAQPDDPASAISVGAYASGRRHGLPIFPDTELCFDIGAAARKLATPVVDVMVLPLSLGPGDYASPGFTYTGMQIVRG